MLYTQGRKLSLPDTNIYINRCPVEDHTGLHSHSFIEIAYVAEGTGIHQIGNTTLPAQKGSIYIINYDIPHEFICEDKTLMVYNCIFKLDFIDTLLINSRNFSDVAHHSLLGNFYKDSINEYMSLHTEGNDNLQILNIYQKMLNEYMLKNLGYKEIIRAHLIELLVVIFRLMASEGAGKYAGIYNTIDYINLNYNQKISIDELAQISLCSKSSFCRRFKELTGANPTDFIQTVRMEEACKLISTSQYNIMDIANMVGYSDMKYFYALFKKITGKMPKELRN